MHVILLQGFAETPVNSASMQRRYCRRFFSARSDAALQAMAQRYADLLQDKTAKDYYDIAHAAAFGRDAWKEASTPSARITT
jgi:acyl transferase domain-containing protein